MFSLCVVSDKCVCEVLNISTNTKFLKFCLHYFIVTSLLKINLCFENSYRIKHFLQSLITYSNVKDTTSFTYRPYIDPINIIQNNEMVFVWKYRKLNKKIIILFEIEKQQQKFYSSIQDLYTQFRDTLNNKRLE